MGTKLAAVVSATIWLASSMPLQANNDSSSGNYYLPFCRENSSSVFLRGVCSGIIETEYYYGEGKICAPSNVSKGQMRAVVIKYLENNPERLNENFHELASNALQKAWPCKK